MNFPNTTFKREGELQDAMLDVAGLSPRSTYSVLERVTNERYEAEMAVFVAEDDLRAAQATLADVQDESKTALLLKSCLEKVGKRLDRREPFCDDLQQAFRIAGELHEEAVKQAIVEQEKVKLAEKALEAAVEERKKAREWENTACRRMR